jgi:histidinol dehydrogenase
MPAGPSELAIYADETCEPAYVAADILSQAEHGIDSQIVLVVTNNTIATAVNMEVSKQLQNIEREKIATKALENSKCIIIKNVQHAFSIINEYAPEHLIIASSNASHLQQMVINAGSVFLGNNTPESAGDYASGTNHTLPTNGNAKAYSGVSLDSFYKKITFQKITKAGISLLANTIITMANAEGLAAHAHAVKIRIDS